MRHRLLDERLKRERELRAMSIHYEHEMGEMRHAELRTTSDQHQLYHDREHLLYEDAVDKASASLKQKLDVLEADQDRWRDQAAQWMTVERFDREHAALIERLDRSIAVLTDKIAAEHDVTTTQVTRDALLEQLAVGRRWLVGLAVTVLVTLVISLLNWLKVF